MFYIVILCACVKTQSNVSCQTNTKRTILLPEMCSRSSRSFSLDIFFIKLYGKRLFYYFIYKLLAIIPIRIVSPLPPNNVIEGVLNSTLIKDTDIYAVGKINHHLDRHGPSRIRPVYCLVLLCCVGYICCLAQG